MTHGRGRRGPATPARSAEGLVVRTQSLGELDRIVTLLSAEEGRIEGVLKGARRVKHGPGAALELLAEARIVYRERPGRDLVRIERVELLRSHFELLSTPEALAAFAHVAELAQVVVMPGEGHPRLIRLVRALLEALGPADRVAEAAERDTAARLARLRLYFDVWVARIEGFWPDLDACAACGRGLSGPRRVSTHVEGALCPGCAASAAGRTVTLSEAALGVAADIRRLAPAELVRRPPAPRAEAELGRLTRLLLESHLERRLITDSR